MKAIEQLPPIIWFIFLSLNAAGIGIWVAIGGYSMVFWHIAMGILCYWGYARAQKSVE
jgi:hypothetical protein